MKKGIHLVKDTFAHFFANGGTSMGAALSYYGIFSLAPLLVLMISMVSIFFGTELTETSVTTELTRTVGTDLATFIQSMVQHDGITSLEPIGTAIGVVVLAVGAYSVFAQLNSSLDTLWHLPKRTRSKMSIKAKVVAFLKDKVSTFSLIPLSGFILLCSIIATTLLQFIGDQTTAVLPASWTLFRLLDIILSIALPTFVFALIYKVLPNTNLPWREVLLGGLITSVLFLLGKLLIGVYLSRFAGVSVYGAASSFVALLIWIYYSSQVFYLGASFIFVYSKKVGYLKNQL